MQAEKATTIYEKSKPGRRAATLPALDVPDRDSRRPAARVARSARPRRACRRSAEPEIVRHYNKLSPPQLRPRQRLLPARLVHDEAQPEAARARRRAARLRPPAPAAVLRARPGRARADVQPRRRAVARSPACRTSALQPSAGSHGELAGVLLTKAYHEDRGETPHEGPRARHLARHQPGDRHDGRLRDRQGRDQRARRGRPRRPAREGNHRRRLPDAHQPQHAWACSTRTSKRSQRSCTTSARRSTTTAPTSTP